MAVTIDGNLGVTSPDFEPSSSTTPTNGLFLPTTNALGFATNSTERLRLDASGNLGLGVTPSAWSLGKALDLGGGASILGYANYTYLSSNAYYNSGWKYIGSGNATYYQQNSGIHAWNTAPSGTAGNAISFTQAMTLDASGNLGIGTTSPATTLHARKDSAGAITYPVYVDNGAGGAGTNVAAIGFTNAGVMKSSITAAVYGNDYMTFCVGSGTTERMRIDSSGNLLVGNTATVSNSRLYVTANGNSPAARFYGSGLSDSQHVVYFDKPSTANTTSQVFVGFTVNAQATGNGQINGNGAGAAAFGSFSDYRLKENITALPDQLANICALKPSEFDYKDGTGHQIGFIAQEMQEVYPDVVGEGEDGMLTITGWSKTEARLVKAIQELTARLELLEAK